MNGTGAGDRQFIREATRPILSHPELPGNPFGTPPQLLQPRYRQELAAEKGMIISLRTVERNDRSPLSGFKTRQRPPAVATLPGWSCGVATSREGHRSPKLARAPWGRIGALFDGT
jgi:hypothetical protein